MDLVVPQQTRSSITVVEQGLRLGLLLALGTLVAVLVQTVLTLRSVLEQVQSTTLPHLDTLLEQALALTATADAAVGKTKPLLGQATKLVQEADAAMSEARATADQVGGAVATVGSVASTSLDALFSSPFF